MKIRKIKLRDKKAQGGVFGLSFSMIFSILLIIFFIVAAFIAIRFFLDIQRQSQIAFFITELQDNIDEIWMSQQTKDFVYNGSLVNGIEYVCFINMTEDVVDADPLEQEVHKYIRYSGKSLDNNLILWPPRQAGELAIKKLEHLQLPSSNPYCIEVRNNKVDIKIEKNFDDALPKVS